MQILLLSRLLFRKLILHFGFQFFKNGSFLPSFFFIFVFSTQLTVNKCSIKVCRCLDSNRASLLSEATALPTEPQPLPILIAGFVTQLSVIPTLRATTDQARKRFTPEERGCYFDGELVFKYLPSSLYR